MEKNKNRVSLSEQRRLLPRTHQVCWFPSMQGEGNRERTTTQTARTGYHGDTNRYLLGVPGFEHLPIVQHVLFNGGHRVREH